jgi:hypothetical protein
LSEVFESIAASQTLPYPEKIEPPPNCAGVILKLTLFANAAMGKAMAKIANSITRRIVSP